MLTKTKSLWRVALVTTLEAEDAAAAMLERHFLQTPSIYTNAETGVATVTVFDRQRPGAAKREELRRAAQSLAECGLAIGDGRWIIERVRREDWSESWKKFFKVIEVGRALLIKPSWSKRRPRRGQAVVVLDPGLSFGTGQHATTSFCLAQLVAARRAGTKQSFLDVGTGSGILAIAAAKLGYGPMRAFDFDPVAVQVARANARRNRVDARLRPTRGDLTRLSAASRRRYDLICANLIDDLLIGQADKLVNWLKPGGRLVLAGILAAQFDPVRGEFARRGLKLVASRVEREWQSGAFEFEAGHAASSG